MDYQPLSLGRMQECGSSLLKSLQNDSMIPLDLLVRESIQNSLDAAAGKQPVKVEFSFTDHTTEAISSLLGGEVADGLRLRYKGKSNTQLVIRDMNTVGLTGPLRIEELKAGAAHGNFFKLVYEVGRSQNEAHRGGSWGLGKTVYFRIGCGLVFYYTRIRKDGYFEERLAVCLVEDERLDDRLQKESHTGIAWWGSGAEGPVLDPGEIASVLKALSVPRYTGDETGTVVVVPFLSSGLGPPGVDPEEPGIPTTQRTQAPWWHRSYSDYVGVAIQRWYGVRLNNRDFRGAPLEASVDGKAITDGDTFPVIRIARELYKKCRAGKAGPTEIRAPVGEGTITAEVNEIGLRAAVAGTTIVGRVAMALVTREDLGMAPPRNLPAPQTVLTGSGHAGSTAPIVGFLRSPGMIVQWDDRGDSTGWAKRVPHPPEGQYLIALVVPDGELPLYPGIAETSGLTAGAAHTLEAYLRNCEKADHNDWVDPVGVTIVRRMRHHVADKLQGIVPQVSAPAPTSRPFLGARTVADRLLPEGFGTDGRRGSADDGDPPPDRPSAPGRTSLPRLDIRKLEYSDQGFTLHWRLVWKGIPGSTDLRLLVDTEGSPISRETWKAEGLGNFPLTVRQAKGSVLQPTDKPKSDWTVSIEKRADMPGIRINPKSGVKAASGTSLTVDGTLDVAVTNPRGAPVRSVLVVDRVTGDRS